MTVTAADFRVNFPEFTSPESYNDSGINFWLEQGYALVNPTPWGSRLDLGVQLFVAHNLVLERQARDDAAYGNPPGVSRGAISSRSVDKVSTSYDTSSSLDTDAGHWSLTVYGSRFIRMARMFGAGPVQI